jgi:hypothetical protein
LVINEIPGPAGIAGLNTWPPTAHAALDFVLFALRERAPALLKEFRDMPGDDAAAAVAWAHRHHIPAAVLLEYLPSLRRAWRDRPGCSSALIFCGHLYLSASVDDAVSSEWTRRNARVENLPASGESLAQWLARARELFTERQRISPRRTKRPRWNEFARHCDWFVQRQILGLSAAKIANETHCDRAAVVRGVAKVVRILDIQPRPRALPGRPRIKP